MTVRTDQLAFLDLGEYQGSIVTLDHRAYVVDLVDSGRMVKSHRRRMKDAAAVHAWLGGLQAPLPGDELLVLAPLLSEATWTGSPVIERVVGPTALLAPRLVAPSTPMELRQRASYAAFAADLHRTSVRLGADVEGSAVGLAERRPAVASTTPAMITATPANWTADGDSSSRITAKMTESAG
jgi:hypothetical protein